MDPMQIVNYSRLNRMHINKTADTGTKIFDDSGGYVLKILGKDDDGNVIAQKYKLLDITKDTQLSIPDIASLEGIDGNELHLDRLTQELIGPSMFHSTTYNIEEVENAINTVLKNQAIEDSNMQLLINFFQQFTPDKLSQISNELSESIAESYAKKSELDQKLGELETRMKNIENRFPSNPDPNGYRPPNYTGNYGISDAYSWKSKLHQMDNEMEDK